MPNSDYQRNRELEMAREEYNQNKTAIQKAVLDLFNINEAISELDINQMLKQFTPTILEMVLEDLVRLNKLTIIDTGNRSNRGFRSTIYKINT